MGAFELGSHPQLTNIHKHLWQLEVDNHYHTCDYWLLKSRIQEHMHLQLVVGSFRNNFENEMMSSLVANKHPTNYTSSERSSMPYDYPRIPKSMQIKVADEIKEQKHEHECEQEHHASCWSENTGKYCMLQPPTQKQKKHLAVQPTFHTTNFQYRSTSWMYYTQITSNHWNSLASILRKCIEGI